MDKNGTVDKAMNSENGHSANTSKMDKLKLNVTWFYFNHFPTDRKTFEWRLPFVGLIGSMLTVFYFVFVLSYSHVEQFAFAQPCYMFVAGVLGYQLYYGLNIGDRKQFTPWIILKLIEILIVTGFAIAFVALDGSWDQFIFGVVAAGFNSIAFGIVISIIYMKQHHRYGLQGILAPESPCSDHDIFDNVDSDNV